MLITANSIEENTRPNLTMPEFVGEVESLLQFEDVNDPFTANRDNLTAFTRQACIQLQMRIPFYQYHHQDIITRLQAPDFCASSKGKLPRGRYDNLFVSVPAPVEDGEEVPDECGRQLVPVFRVPWTKWAAVARGDYQQCWNLVRSCVEDCGSSSDYGPAPEQYKAFFIAINDSGEFYLGPKLRDGDQLELEWTGIKSVYSDSDMLNWGMEVAECIAKYVGAQMELNKRDRPNKYQALMASYNSLLARLFTNMKAYDVPISRYNTVLPIPR